MTRVSLQALAADLADRFAALNVMEDGPERLAAFNDLVWRTDDLHELTKSAYRQYAQQRHHLTSRGLP